MVLSLLSEVHSHLAVVTEPDNQPHPDSLPVHICTVSISKVYSDINLHPKTHRVERIPTSSTNTGTPYCKNKKPSQVSVLTLWQHALGCLCNH